MTSLTSRRSSGRLLVFMLIMSMVSALLLVSCGGDGGDDTAGDKPPVTGQGVEITLVTHDSFDLSDSVLAEFERQSGIKVKVLRAGDAVEMVNQAILTKGNPQGDVLFGIDSNLLTRAFDEDLFEPYRSPRLEQVHPDFQVDPDDRVTPVDFGDVCINVDRHWFATHDLAIPETLEDLAKPAYKGLLVVQDPASSTPGLAFMLATIAHFGTDVTSGDTGGVSAGPAWLTYWKQLRDNGVAVTSGWEQAYYDRFSGGSGSGDRPLVVSYATSPAAEVEDPTTPPEDAPTQAISATCFRQVEFAGILTGNRNPEAAQKLIDFMLSTTFQNDIPARMFVEPVVDDATVPESFTRYAATVEDPLTLSPATIAENRDAWVGDWSRTMGQ